MNNFITNENTPEIIKALEEIFLDGDPIRTMVLLTDLTDLGIKHGLVDETARALIGPLHHLLAEIAIHKNKAAEL